jgi:hypothetical protein
MLHTVIKVLDKVQYVAYSIIIVNVVRQMVKRIKKSMKQD